MAAYVLLDGSNVVQSGGAIVWDGVTNLSLPAGITAVALPADAPPMRRGDTYNPGTNTVTPRANTDSETRVANASTLAANISTALARLRQIKTQADTFVAQADYGTANLANLNDLLHKSQLIASAVGDLSTYLLYVAHVVGNQLDSTA